MTDQFFYAAPGAKRAAGNSDRDRDDSGPKGEGPKRAAGGGEGGPKQVAGRKRPRTHKW